jgi:hypothetical protein
MIRTLHTTCFNKPNTTIIRSYCNMCTITLSNVKEKTYHQISQHIQSCIILHIRTSSWRVSSPSLSDIVRYPTYGRLRSGSAEAVSHLLFAKAQTVSQTYKTREEFASFPRKWSARSAQLQQSRLPRPRPRLERRAARGHRPPPAPSPSPRHRGERGAPTRARCAPSPTCPPCRPGAPPVTHRPRGGQPKATREALCPACLLCCPQRSPLVTRPLHNPRCDGCPCPSIAAPLSCPHPRSPFASSPRLHALAPPSTYIRPERRRRRRIVGTAAAPAPTCGLRRCCRRAIRRGVRWSGLDSTARGGEADLCSAIRRGFWAGLWGFCMEFLLRNGLPAGGVRGVRAEIRIWAWVADVPYEVVE